MGNHHRIAASRRAIALLTAAATLSGLAAVAVPTAVAEAPAAAKPSVIINEVFAGNTKELGDPVAQRDDWVELKNTGDKPVDVKGWGIYDEKQKKHYTIGVDKEINADTVVQPNGYLVAYIDYNGEPGLGSDADSVYLTSSVGDKYDAGAEVDATTWKLADKMTAAQSWSRADDGTFKVSDQPTPGAANEFPSSTPTPEPGETMTVDAWPGLDTVTAIDADGEFGAKGQSGDHTDGNLSGLVYESGRDGAADTLWAADNDLNPTLGNTEDKGPGSINKFVLDAATGTWKQDPTGGWTFDVNGQTKGGKQLHFKDGKGGVDSEGITLIDGDSSKGVFIGAERDNENKNVPRPSILSYDANAAATDTNGDGAQDLAAMHEWNLVAPLSQFGVTLGKDDANLGVEGIAFIPDGVLTAKHFKVNLDPNNVHDYDPAGTANDYGGLFFAALEKTNAIYAFALATVAGKDVAYPIAQIPLPAAAANAGFDGPRDLTWDGEHGQLLAEGDNDNGTGAKIATYTFDQNGTLALTKLTATPAEIAGQNSEGFAITPDSAATTVKGGVEGKTYKPVFWADDGVTGGHSLRRGWIEATNPNPQPNPQDSAKVTLFGITDFHGHIENGGYLATALKETKAANPNTLFVGAGDLVGASAFESSIANDVPAMDQLKAMGLAVSATGNHEYDKGAADLANRIVPGIAPAKYVVANVTGDVLKGKVQPYVIEESGGKKIAFIGGIFKTLADSVSPAGMKGITVTDPIEAINKYADQLSDGDPSNGEADAVVALVHADANDLKNLDANVDAVLAGHTHLYETAKTDTGAPIIETANYGVEYSTTDLEITGSGKDAKVSATAAKHDVFTQDQDGKDVPLFEADPAVNQIYLDAKAAADAKGNEVLGTLADDATFNRGASKPGDLSTVGNNRGVESTLGILNGNAAKWAAEQSGQKADIGVINAGGMRADLDPNGDKQVTLKEAHDVLPFGNSNAVVTLTGKQLKTLIEQQWQPADAQRPVLWLGFSDNVDYQYDTYVATVDGKQVPRGAVHDLTVNGKAVHDNDTYLIAGNSFLLAGGDNFTVFQQGTGYVDTGYIDFDGFSDYLKAHPKLESAKTRHSAGFSAARLADDGTVTFTVSGLAFTTDEPRPWGVRLTANGVDFGDLTGLDYTGEEQGPGAGSITVTKKLTDAERAAFVAAAAKAPAAAKDAAAADGGAFAIGAATVETLLTKPQAERPTPQPEPTPTPEPTPEPQPEPTPEPTPTPEPEPTPSPEPEPNPTPTPDHETPTTQEQPISKPQNKPQAQQTDTATGTPNGGAQHGRQDTSKPSVQSQGKTGKPVTAERGGSAQVTVRRLADTGSSVAWMALATAVLLALGVIGVAALGVRRDDGR
ncbi:MULTISPECIES: 5'-nucleotidase C-terminal domain-containing protein [Bifidobacterium]|uniref:5'-nucleotidase C-terminal domain-containing protein n=1 Tax=Bifidobacterium TaxID=1678 RepID=UPI001BDD1AFC|nr:MULTISPECIES: 5'-nucleotidase C-terminal domain-containing protein [Bifidobacterium]MBT1161096.1 5'-nucleotidase C-terminal domain-containing protein [Bifidobacterium sp. SO1]MBW3078170.1 5'-nucleotidase C-terminal domain-containing protein [Bifidobacterium simiiventris]